MTTYKQDINIDICIAKLEDAKYIFDLVNCVFAKFFKEVSQRYKNIREVENIIKDGNYLKLVLNNEIIGAVVWKIKENDVGYYGPLVIRDDYQKKGYGRKMINYVEELLRSLGCKVVQINAMNWKGYLHKFYDRLGYKKVGTYPFSDRHELYTDRETYFIIYEKSLV